MGFTSKYTSQQVEDLLDQMAGGGVGGGVAVKDEGVTVVANATELDFVGTDVLAVNEGGVTKAKIYIPAPAYSSHFNSADGTTDASVANMPVTSLNTASPIAEGSPYKIGSWVAGTAHNTLRNSTLVYSTAGFFKVVNNIDTVISVEVLDADNVSVLAQNQVIIAGNTSSTMSNITITISSFQADGDKYRALFSCNINIASIIPSGGKFSVRIRHNNSVDGVFTKLQQDIFYDTDAIQASQDTPTIGETAGNVLTRYISGVNWYNLNSAFTANLSNIDSLNYLSYPTTQVIVEGSEYGLPTLNLLGSNLTGWANRFDRNDCTYLNTNWRITTANISTMSNTANITSTLKDWVDHSSNSANASICINTYTENATRIYEDFRLETNRLRGDATTAWDSTQSLLTFDTGDGLQVLHSRLVYPSLNFTGYSPTPGTQPNYVPAVGNRKYIRRFWHTTNTFSNGVLTFAGHNITEAMLASNDLLLEVSVDKANWFSLNGDYMGGPLSDGGLCRINKDVNGFVGATINNSKIEFTFGTGLFSTEVFVRISFRDSVLGRTIFIDSISLNWI